MEILVLEPANFKGYNIQDIFVTYFGCCNIFFGVVQHRVTCIWLLWYFQSRSNCQTLFHLNCHVIQLSWMPSDLVQARYTSTLHACGVVLEPALWQELWHSSCLVSWIGFHNLRRKAVSIRTLHVPAFAVSELSQIMRCDTKFCLLSNLVVTINDIEKAHYIYCLRSSENLLLVGSCDI